MNEDGSDEKLEALLRHALSRAPGMEPPAGFAREMASLAADQPEAAALEIRATRALVSLAVLGTGACALLFIDASRVFHLLGRAPWPLLMTAAAAIGALKLAEIAQVPTSPLRRR
jgi:hypothetical protein